MCLAAAEDLSTFKGDSCQRARNNLQSIDDVFRAQKHRNADMLSVLTIRLQDSSTKVKACERSRFRDDRDRALPQRAKVKTLLLSARAHSLRRTNLFRKIAEVVKRSSTTPYFMNKKALLVERFDLFSRHELGFCGELDKRNLKLRIPQISGHTLSAEAVRR